MDKKGFAAELLKALVIFLAGGFIYGLIEIIYRGHTHPSMFVLGGLCLLWIGGFDSFFVKAPPLWVQLIAGGAFITAAEFACGLIFNVALGMKVWDYSDIPLNIMGQICLPYSFAWVMLSLPAVIAENIMRGAFERGLSVDQPL